MSQDDDLLARLGSIAREREQEADEELAAPTLALRDAAALREAVIAQALAQARPRRAAAPVRRAFAGAMVAAAALILLWLLPKRVAPLPEYALLHRGGLAQERGTVHGEVLQLRPSSRLELELKPERDVVGEVQLRVLVQRGTELSPLSISQIERSDTGSFRVTLSAEHALGTRFGPLTIVAVVCRREVCEKAEEALHAASQTAGAWQVLRIAAVYAQ